MSAEALWRLDATAQADLVRRGEVTPHELLDAALGRVERLNGRLNAVIATFEDLARQQIATLAPDARFRGVPLLLKDAAQELSGTPYCLGTKVLRDCGWASTKTTEVTRRLMEAGFVVFGKTNVPELSSGFTTEPAAFGPTRNPWDLGRTAGGSSGGSAAAVAAGMVAIAHGCDATGSLRVPASACGVATLRPSAGVLPSLAPANQPSDVWIDFVLSRSVRDLAGVLEAIGDSAALAPREPMRSLRVGLLRDDPFSALPLHEECVRAVDAAGETLRELGHEVAEDWPPAFRDFFSRLGPSLGPGIARARLAQAEWLESAAGRALTPDDLSETHWRQIKWARSQPETPAGPETESDAAVDAVLEWWREGYDVLIAPVLRQPPWPLGTPDGGETGGLFVFPASFTGQPAMSLPLHWTPEGLPVGIQVIGAPRADRLLLTLAAELERAMPWVDRWPVVAEA